MVYFNKPDLDEFVILHPLHLMGAIKQIVRCGMPKGRGELWCPCCCLESVQSLKRMLKNRVLLYATFPEGLHLRYRAVHHTHQAMRPLHPYAAPPLLRVLSPCC